MKKLLSILLLACMCLALVSCGGVPKLRPDRAHNVKYKPSGSPVVLSFTADEEAEYTVRHETEAEDVVCTAFADEALTQPVSHPSEAGSFCFTLPMERGETVYLQLVYTVSGTEKGSLTVSKYAGTDTPDVNYGHPTALTLGTPKTVAAGDGSTEVFSFSATGPALYTFICTGSPETEVKFFADSWCMEPLEKVNNTKYPDEHYFTTDEIISSSGRNMEKDETIYMSVKAPGSASSCTISVNALQTAPDPRSAMERLSYITDGYYSYHPQLLICSDPAEKYKYGVGDYFIGSFATPITDYMSSQGTGNGKSVYDYISSSELRMLADGYYVIYSCDELQTGIDGLWGGGRLDVDSFSKGSSAEYGTYTVTSIATSKGYFFNQEGFGDDGIIDYYEITGTKSYDKYTVVSAIGIVYNSFTYEVFDAAGYLGEKIKLDSGVKKRDSVDAYLEAIEKTRDDLKTMDFVFYSTKNGLKLWGVFPAGEATVPTTSTASVGLPSVIPEAFVPEYMIKVASSSGLRLRSGPGTDYETFAIIDNGIELRSYAEQDGWYYVCYMGRYGWISSEYAAPV